MNLICCARVVIFPSPLISIMSTHIGFHGYRRLHHFQNLSRIPYLKKLRCASLPDTALQHNCICIVPVRWKRNRIEDHLVHLKEDELEEDFVRGSGPGGQATNKTSNCVVLKHIPTGIVVKCHQTRSQTKNQQIARKILREKLDIHFKGDDSIIIQEQKKEQQKKHEKKRKTRIKLEKLKAFKASLQDNDSDN
ncbi:mitochondrial translation release factor in rescue-like [Glandiceps talaboti]